MWTKLSLMILACAAQGVDAFAGGTSFASELALPSQATHVSNLRMLHVTRRREAFTHTARLQRRSSFSSMRSKLQDSGGSRDQADLSAKFLVWSTWLVYMQQIFFSDQPCGTQAKGDLCGIGLPTIT